PTGASATVAPSFSRNAQADSSPASEAIRQRYVPRSQQRSRAFRKFASPMLLIRFAIRGLGDAATHRPEPARRMRKYLASSNILQLRCGLFSAIGACPLPQAAGDAG